MYILLPRQGAEVFLLIAVGVVWVGGQLFCSHKLRWLTCAPNNSLSSTVHYPGRVQGLLSYVLQVVMGRTCSPTLLTLRLALLPAVSSKGKGIFLSSHMPPHSRQRCDRSALLLSCLQGWLICVTSNRVSSSVLPRIAAGIAEGWSHPSWVQGWGKTNFLLRNKASIVAPVSKVGQGHPS